MDGKEKKVFYDIHCHALNLSHAGLLAFLNRFLKDRTVSFSGLLGKGKFLQIICRLLGINFSVKLIKILLIILSGALSGIVLLAISKYEYFLSAKVSNIILFCAFAVVFAALIFTLWILRKISLGGSDLVTDTLRKNINLLSVIENDAGSLFLSMELDILAADERYKGLIDKYRTASTNKYSSFIKNLEEKWKENGNEIQIKTKEGELLTYNKVVITPLIIDFGYKDFDIPGIHYNKPPRKPVVEQVVDVFNGIRDYRERSPVKILDIYPFLGINTRNYDLGTVSVAPKGIKDTLYSSLKSRKIPQSVKENVRDTLENKVAYIEKTGKLVIYKRATNIGNDLRTVSSHVQIDENILNKIGAMSDETHDLDERNNIPKMLEKYFGEYNNTKYGTFTKKSREHYFPDEKDAKKREKMIPVRGIDDLRSHFFAGIKLYPPLGFDPWPDYDDRPADTATEFDKVNYLYQFCSEKGIPITVHCSPGGFKAAHHGIEYTNPEKWRKVLSVYNNLKINFAHCGFDINKPYKVWLDTILALMGEYKNVYVDFSYIGNNKDFYKFLKERIIDKGYEDRILFGSDFPINLFGIDSHEDYLKNFFRSSLDANLKHKFCSENPQKFLWI
ncbi:MAG: Amidohydrolase [Candidatus Brocadia sinica]|nr:MAG: Amidohydrolase [Candidatus Brocadia sinica]